MQTVTHALGGLAIAQTAITLELVEMGETGTVHPFFAGALFLLFGFAGAVAPDVVMVPMFIWDKVKGRQPMTNEGPITYVLKELSHSLPLWIALFLFAWLTLPEGVLRDLSLVFVVCGLFAGVLPDIPTHSEERFRRTDCTFLYPLNDVFKKLFGFSALRWPNEKWEYRFDHGVLWPLKPWELRINEAIWICLIGLWITEIIHSFMQ